MQPPLPPNPELDNFFDPPMPNTVGAGRTGPPPPPPAGVDTREFHHSTPGGFGNTPMPSLDSNGTGQTGLNPFDPQRLLLTAQQSAMGLYLTLQQAAQSGSAKEGANSILSGMSSLNFGTGGISEMNNPVSTVINEKFGVMQPWREFALPMAKPADGAAACGSLMQNVGRYRANYTLCFFLWQLICLLLLPGAILLFTVLGAAWYVDEL